MKLLHLGDLHIGKKLNNHKLIEDQKYALREVIEFFSHDDIDGLMIAGDLYDVANPSSEAISVVDWFLTELSTFHKPIFIISGNHDSSERTSYASSLLAKQQIYISPTFSGSVEHVTLTDEYGPITFWLFPFVKPINIAGFFPDAQINSYSDAFRLLVDSCDIDPAQRNVALIHQFVVSGMKQPEISDSEILSVGGLDGVESSIFDVFDYVAMGHIHKSQAMGRETCRYSGSLLKYSLSEVNYVKRFPVVDIKDKSQDIEIDYFSFKPLRDLRAVKGSLDEILSSDESEEQRNDYIHVTLTDDFLNDEAIFKLRSYYPHIMSYELDNYLSQNVNNNLTFADVTVKKDPLEHFKDFYSVIKGKPLNENQEQYMIDIINSVLNEDE